MCAVCWLLFVVCCLLSVTVVRRVLFEACCVRFAVWCWWLGVARCLLRVRCLVAVV